MNYNNMTLEEKIGQMLCLSFVGTEYNEQLQNLVEKYNIGTIIHYPISIAKQKAYKEDNDFNILLNAEINSNL